VKSKKVGESDEGRIGLIRRFLRTQTTLALATSSPSSATGGNAGPTEDGPHATPLFYLIGETAAGGLCLYWFSSPSSRHSRDLRSHPAASVAVYRPARRWQQIRGVQMAGQASVVRSRTERSSVARAYIERFQLGAEFESAIASSRLYRFSPAWVRFLDNSRGFGYQFEAVLADLR
jgi:uncharacterized protein YhbP (UPF0306 family)